MSILLYYSNRCNYCRKLITIMSKNLEQKQLSNVHFVNIDRRITKNGNTYALLDNGQEFHIPRAIESVPAIIILNEGNNILFGNSIYQYFGLNLILNSGKSGGSREQITQTDDPEPFTFEGVACSNVGITSDKYSFFDSASDEMLAGGCGGLRQLHSYITLNDYDNGNLRINTPEDSGDGPKINFDLNKLQEQRLKDIQMKGGPPLDTRIF